MTNDSKERPVVMIWGEPRTDDYEGPVNLWGLPDWVFLVVCSVLSMSVVVCVGLVLVAGGRSLVMWIAERLAA